MVYHPGFQFLTSDKSGIDYQTEANTNITVIGRMVNEAIRALTDANVKGTGGVVGTYDHNIIGDAMMKIYHGALSADTSYGVTLQREQFEVLFNQLSSKSITLFSDSLTSYTGSTVPVPWTLQSGSFTFSASGATVSSGNSYMAAGNIAWKPIVSLGGTKKLALEVQAAFTTPATLSTGTNGSLCLWIDSTTYYMAYISNTTFYITRNGVSLTSVAFVPAVSKAHVISLQLDNTGALTATITPSGGTTTTLTANDATPLTGGFFIGVGGDTNVIVSDASVIGPFPDAGIPF